MSAVELRCPEVELAGEDLETVNEEYDRRGWSDGLPVIPATRDRVLRMLAATDHDPQRLVGVIPPRGGRATVEVLAVQAVMAGCPPPCFPVVIAAVRAVCDPAFTLTSVQSTTHPASPLVVVNGPAARELGFSGGAGCFGGGSRANATVGRAVRLAMRNIGGARPGEGDRATQGHPGKFAYCIAENTERNPWQPLHVERGFDPSDSAVTVIGGEAPHNINNHVGTSAVHILTVCADAMSTIAANNPFSVGNGTEMHLVLGPEHAATVAEDGWTKADVRRFLYEHARNRLRRLRLGGMWGMHNWPAWFDAFGDDDLVPVVDSPERIVVLVAGGDGKHSSCVPTQGSTRSVTVSIEVTGRPTTAFHQEESDGTART